MPARKKAKAKAKAGRPRQKVRVRVGLAASIKEFSSAVLANMNEHYWDRADAVLDGAISPDQYAAQSSYLRALKIAAQIVKATLLVHDEEEAEDEADERTRRNGKDIN